MFNAALLVSFKEFTSKSNQLTLNLTVRPSVWLSDICSKQHTQANLYYSCF